MTITTEEVRALAEGCEGVTPGPWDIIGNRVVNLMGDAELGTWTVAEAWWPVNRDHLRRCSPEFILALAQDWLRMKEEAAEREKLDRDAGENIAIGTEIEIAAVRSQGKAEGLEIAAAIVSASPTQMDSESVNARCVNLAAKIRAAATPEPHHNAS